MSQLKFKFGLFQAISLVVGNIVGSGILLLPSSLAAYGSFGLFGWALTSVGAVCLGLIFASLSHRYTNSGGPYTYTREVLGNFMGFQVAWTYWMANTISNIAVVIAFVSYLSAAYPILFMSKGVTLGISLMSLWSLVALNMVGLKFFARFQLVITLLKIVPLIIMAIIGIGSLHMDHIIPFTSPSNMSWYQVLFATMSMSLFSFIGIESATIPSEYMEDPKKTVARATIAGTLIAAFIYLWLNVVIMGILGPKTLALSQAPFSDAFHSLFGGHAGFIMALVGAFTCFSTLNGWIMIQAQIPMAAARDGLFPPILGKLTKGGVPGISLMVSSLLMTTLIVFNYKISLVNQFSFIVTLTSFSILLPYFLTALAELVFIFRQKLPLKKTWKSFLVVGIALLYTLFAIQGVGADSFLLGFGLLILGFPIYFITPRLSAH